jgi:hypothetical protein
MIQISLRAESGMMAQTIPVETKAVVVSWNGLPADSLPEASDTAETMATIMQYGSATIQLTEAEISMVSGEDYDVEVIYGNNGNGDSDTMIIGVNEDTRSALQDAGFSIAVRANNIEIEAGDTTTIQFDIRAPEGITKEVYFVIEFYIQSEFSCRNSDSGCYHQSALATIIVSEAESGGGIEALGENSTIVFAGIGGAILVVAVVVVVLKRKKEQTFAQDEDDFDEYDDDDLDDEYDDEFEEDFDDDFFDDL